LAKGGVVWFNGYDPNPLVIHVGETVQWKLVGGIHTVTSTEPKNATAWAFDSSPLFPVAAALGDLSPGRLLPPGSVYENDTTFLPQGTYTVFCKIHPGMMGNLTVTGGIPVDRYVNVVAGWGDPNYAVQAFAPQNVVVPQGTIIRWTLLNPAEPHTITGLNSTGAIAWDSSPALPPGLPPVMTVPGTVFNWTFTTEGTYTYFCKLHAYKIGESWVGMTGTIIVTPSAADTVGGLSTTAYAGLGLAIVALLIAIGFGVMRRKGPGASPPP
jgi:plastocyanin